MFNGTVSIVHFSVMSEGQVMTSQVTSIGGILCYKCCEKNVLEFGILFSDLGGGYCCMGRGLL